MKWKKHILVNFTPPPPRRNNYHQLSRNGNKSKSKSKNWNFFLFHLVIEKKKIGHHHHHHKAIIFCTIITMIRMMMAVVDPKSCNSNPIMILITFCTFVCVCVCFFYYEMKKVVKKKRVKHCLATVIFMINDWKFVNFFLKNLNKKQTQIINSMDGSIRQMVQFFFCIKPHTHR